jgi:AcrR family transcriptional regulator
MDRRVRRTRDALGDALVALMQEREFESITVADVLSRAGVSRSTFYAHFRDTDDLLLSDVEEFFEATANALSERGEDSERVAPVRELFAHVLEMRAFLAALIVSGRLHTNLELARGHFARGIERRLGELARARTLTAVQRAALGHAHAGALIALLLWWIRREPRESPAEMDELFHRTVWGGAWARGADPHAARRRH